MQIIHHRINSISALNAIATNSGVEIDVRYHENNLILHHDPFNHHTQFVESLDDFLANYKLMGPLILNIKTEGVEEKCIELMVKYNIKNWFFLDLSMPYFAIYAEKAKSKSIVGFSSDNLAVRFSEREPIEYALAFKGKAKWVWVDCFTEMPLNDNSYKSLKQNFNICLVSPELQKHSTERIKEFKEKTKLMAIDAVCTKKPELWRE